MQHVDLSMDRNHERIHYELLLPSGMVRESPLRTTFTRNPIDMFAPRPQFAGRKWWLLIPAVVAIVASLGLGCAVVAYGFMMPQAKVFSDLKLLLEWYEKVGHLLAPGSVLC